MSRCSRSRSGCWKQRRRKGRPRGDFGIIEGLITIPRINARESYFRNNLAAEAIVTLRQHSEETAHHMDSLLPARK